MPNTEIGFRHYRPRHSRFFTGGDNRGGATMAFASPKHIDDLTADDTVTVSFSFCSRNDNFERKTGRVVAVRRLAATPITIKGNEFAAFFKPDRGVFTVNDLLFEAANAQTGVFGDLQPDDRNTIAGFLANAIG